MIEIIKEKIVESLSTVSATKGRPEDAPPGGKAPRIVSATSGKVRVRPQGGGNAKDVETLRIMEMLREKFWLKEQFKI